MCVNEIYVCKMLTWSRMFFDSKIRPQFSFSVFINLLAIIIHIKNVVLYSVVLDMWEPHRKFVAVKFVWFCCIIIINKTKRKKKRIVHCIADWAGELTRIQHIYINMMRLCHRWLNVATKHDIAYFSIFH